ncbi:hypothetical protein GCM10010371_69700 [Streptomyces subrutilus]|uniref:Uncharacterized protein n=1 Tax=Streptomyces subrutilus TaxID=36818 RepID=A0A918VJD1_9ACTN|nr:hypothetical protein GCM10010371_69700 [Streptomyces subrutilus]
MREPVGSSACPNMSLPRGLHQYGGYRIWQPLLGATEFTHMFMRRTPETENEHADSKPNSPTPPDTPNPHTEKAPTAYGERLSPL